MRELIYVALFLGLVSARPLREAFRALEPGQQLALALLFALVFAGQAASREKETYPFVRWGMYRKEPDQVVYHRYRGIRPDGVQESLPIADFVRVTDKRFVLRLSDLARAAQRAQDPAARARFRALYEGALVGSLAAYRTRYPDRLWTDVEVSRCEVDSTEFRRGEPETCEMLWRVPVPVPGTETETDG